MMLGSIRICQISKMLDLTTPILLEILDFKFQQLCSRNVFQKSVSIISAIARDIFRHFTRMM